MDLPQNRQVEVQEKLQIPILFEFPFQSLEMVLGNQDIRGNAGLFLEKIGLFLRVFGFLDDFLEKRLEKCGGVLENARISQEIPQKLNKPPRFPDLPANTRRRGTKSPGKP